MHVLLVSKGTVNQNFIMVSLSIENLDCIALEVVGDLVSAINQISLLLVGKYKAPTELPALLTRESKNKWIITFRRPLKTCEKVTLTLWPPVYKIILHFICYSRKQFYGLTIKVKHIKRA